jgi:glycosyltransferase involved in cell wall biosynthesis
MLTPVLTQKPANTSKESFRHASYDLSIIIPAKNEESRIATTLRKLQRNLATFGISYQVIVVNDGSNDQTARVASLFGATVINHSTNKGIAAAFRTGAKASSGKVIMLCPADIDDFEFLKEAIHASGKYEVVSVSKRHPDSVVLGYSFWRWLLSNGYQSLVSLLFGASDFCTDTHYIKLYNGPILRIIINQCIIDGPVGETEIMLLARDAGCTFFEIPARILHNGRHSKMSGKLIIRTLMELMILRIKRRKLRPEDLIPKQRFSDTTHGSSKMAKET